MSKVSYKNHQGLKAEKQFAKQFNAELVSKLSLQYKDIDAVFHHKALGDLTVSIKDQSKAVKAYGNFSFEYQLVSTQFGFRKLGNLLTCKADYYVIKANNKWYIFKTHELHQYIKSILDTVRRAKTSDALERANRKAGRTYDRAWNYIIKVEDLEKIANQICDVK